MRMLPIGPLDGFGGRLVDKRPRPRVARPSGLPAAAGSPEGLRYSQCCASITERVLHDERVVDDAAADEMLLDDPLEHRRIARARTTRLRDRRRRSGRLRRCAGSSPWCAGCRPARTGRAPSAGASESPTPQGRGPCRSTSASSDRSRERCAAARPESPMLSAIARCASSAISPYWPQPPSPSL